MPRERDPRPEPEAAATAAAGGSATGEGTLDIPEALQTEIREFARRLPEMDYYEVLGVPREADAPAIREGFFERTKRYHPDRYFRKRLGPYAGLLSEIFKRVATAHEVLRDPALRSRYDKGLGAPAAAPPATAPLTQPGRPRPKAAPRPSSLRARRGVRPAGFALRTLERQLALTREKARARFKEALQLRERGRWAAAASRLGIALALDPRERAYQEAMAEILPRANAERAERLLALVEARLAEDRGAAAVEALESAAELRPTDAGLAHRVAVLVVDTGGDPARAAHWAERAVELDETVARYRETLAEIQRRATRRPTRAGARSGEGAHG